MTKKLSVAFVWHMHQPFYKDHLTNKYFMPWVRLHAIKDYLDMVLILKKFPDIKQTFNLVPSLIDQLNDYAFNNAHDKHSLLMIKPESEFTYDDKVFILERFFDANYNRMILPNEYYYQLYQKAKSQGASANIDNFSNQEYSDIITWFNLVWFDPMWYEEIPELQELYNQNRNFTLTQRVRLLEIQRYLIQQIIPTYKEFQDKGQIEVTTTPYYHPIMPLLIDTEAAKIARPGMSLPDRFSHIEDAQKHLMKAIDQYKSIFGFAPKGIWPSEQSVSPETVKLMIEAGIKWTISDEGVLAASIKKEFNRNFYGNLEEPKDLCQPYKFSIGDKSIDMIFRNVVYSDLIGFHFGKMDPNQAAWELHDRIKDIQAKLIYSTDNHLLTIALDGENCWESYLKDGIPFLNTLYERLSKDTTLNITTVSGYLEDNPPPKTLHYLHSGSWINRDFHIWIGDPAKNTGWSYLKNTRDDLTRLIKENNYDSKTIDKAWEELYIAEGSDWFWWYGDPNFSSQDDLFDEQFRLHLQNVYRILHEPVPAQLFVPVEVYLGRSLKYPSSRFTPTIDGKEDSYDEWRQAGLIEIPSGAMYQSDKVLRRIWFGYDKKNLNIRLDTVQSICSEDYEVYIYTYKPGETRFNSNVRFKILKDISVKTLRYRFSHEIHITPRCNYSTITVSEAIEYGLWQLQKNTNAKIGIGSVVELSMPFEELDILPGEEVCFVVAITKSQVLLEIEPQNKAVTVKRG